MIAKIQLLSNSALTFHTSLSLVIFVTSEDTEGGPK
jgi:hypothetical protein